MTPSHRRSIWIGYDMREAAAYGVAHMTACQRTEDSVPVTAILLQELRDQGLYTRPTEIRNGRLWDVISEAPMATEFAISRFLLPTLAHQHWAVHGGWALFMDCDMLVRKSLVPLFQQCEQNSHMAVMCVKHNHSPPEAIKMDNQLQTLYARKNWSSVFALNLDHPANKALTVELVNTVPGRDLHRFCWLDDCLIGSLGPQWNWLQNHSSLDIDPAIVHFTEGLPYLEGYEKTPYAREWWQMFSFWLNNQ